MELQTFIDRSRSVPFKEKGRDFDGWDCWGLVKFGLKLVYDYQAPDSQDYKTVQQVEQTWELFQRGMTYFDKVEQPRTGDVVTFRVLGKRGRYPHAGLMLDGRNFLHIDAGMVSARVDSVTGFEWRNSLVGYYRRSAPCPKLLK